MLVKVYTDGAARGNPDGPGGYGAVLEYVDGKGQLHNLPVRPDFPLLHHLYKLLQAFIRSSFFYLLL